MRVRAGAGWGEGREKGEPDKGECPVDIPPGERAYPEVRPGLSRAAGRRSGKGIRGQWRYLKEKASDYVVIPAKAGIQSLKNIGRQADSGCQLALA